MRDGQLMTYKKTTTNQQQQQKENLYVDSMRGCQPITIQQQKQINNNKMNTCML